MFKQTLLAGVIAVALTACSSSGSTNQPTNQPLTNKQEKQEQGKQGQQEQGKQEQATEQFGGLYVDIDGYDGNGYTDYIELAPSTKNDLHHNEIAISQAKFNQLQKYQYSQFGHKVLPTSSTKPDDIKFGNAFFTSFGKLTSPTDMPSGTATYKGHAIYLNENAQNSGDIKQGTSQFSVDFAQHTLTGKLDVNSRSIALPTATINGNSFSSNRDNLSVKGYFYGPQAAELGGLYEFDRPKDADEPAFMGAFGATKQ